MSEGAAGRPSSLRLYFLIALMTTLWSFNFIAAKFALKEFPALLASGIRIAFAGLAMLPIYAYYSRRGETVWARADVPKLISLGMLGVALNQLFFVLGISRTSVAHAAIVIAFTPILVLLLAFFAGQERLRPANVTGLLTALTGVVVLQMLSGKQGDASPLGDSLVFVASLTFAIFSVYGKRETGRIHSAVLNTFAYSGSGLVLLPMTLWLGKEFRFGEVSLTAWASLLYMALFASVLCYLIYYYALTYVPASRVAAFSYMQPVLATLMAIPLLGEHPTLSVAFGGILVLAGVFLAERA